MEENVSLDLAAFEKKSKPRNPLYAFLLGFLPGLGQFYNGQLKKAGIFFAAFLAGVLLMGFLGMAHTFYGFMIMLAIMIAARIYLWELPLTVAMLILH